MHLILQYSIYLFKENFLISSQQRIIQDFLLVSYFLEEFQNMNFCCKIVGMWKSRNARRRNRHTSSLKPIAVKEAVCLLSP